MEQQRLVFLVKICHQSQKSPGIGSAEGVNIIDTSGVDTANVDNSELVYKCVDDISSSGKTICEMLLQSLDEQQQI